MYYVYMLRCENRSIYTGITTDVRRRWEEHRSGQGKGAKYTRVNKPERILAVWQCRDRSAASRLEYRIKALPKERKEALALDGDLSVLGDRIRAEAYERVRDNKCTG